MSTRLRTRLAKLEFTRAIQREKRVVIRFGRLKRLPPDYRENATSRRLQVPASILPIQIGMNSKSGPDLIRDPRQPAEQEKG
jgi:hypothetical protein